MKVSFLIPSLVAGGAEHVITHMANYWAARQYDVSIITLDHSKNAPFYPLSPAVKLIPLNLLKSEKGYLKPLLFLRQIRAVRKTIRRTDPEVLISFLDITIFIALTISPFIKAKVVVSERNNPYLNETNPVLKKINLFLYRFADRLVLQTRKIAVTFPAHLQDKIRIISNPVFKPFIYKSDYELNEEQPTIVSIGRLQKQKAHDFLIRTFASVARQNKHLSLLIIGEGSERDQLKALCKEEKIESQVILFGRTSQPETILQQADIFVLTSRFEGFPNALCEAMAIGLPCIATRCPFGPEEIIEDGINGLLIDVDDEEALQKALTLLLTSSSLRKQLGEQAKKIAQRLSPAQVMLQWEVMIERIL